MCVFSLQLVSETFLILRRNERDMIKRNIYILVFTLTASFSCPDLMKREFSRQISEKYLNTKFHKNPYSGSRDVPASYAVQRQSHAAQHTTHNHNQAHSKHRTTHTQEHDMLPQHQS